MTASYPCISGTQLQIGEAHSGHPASGVGGPGHRKLAPAQALWLASKQPHLAFDNENFVLPQIPLQMHLQGGEEGSRTHGLLDDHPVVAISSR